MSTLLRFGVRGLPAAETTLVRTLFKLYHHGASDFRWALVDAPPYDALLVDSSVGNTGAMQGYQAVKAVLTLGSAAVTALPNTLTRPLHSEILEAWLLQTQLQFFPEKGPSTLIQAQQPQANTSQAADTDVYKLTRWPPATMLRNDPSLIRMATALSRRSMQTSELARISQQPVESAHAFVLAMRHAGLLERSPSARAARPSRQEGSDTRPAAQQKIERSLISRIRQRLGL